MPATVSKRGEKWRVVEADSGVIVKNAKGTAVDGGGHESKYRAIAQARAVSAAHERKKGK